MFHRCCTIICLSLFLATPCLGVQGVPPGTESEQIDTCKNFLNRALDVETSLLFAAIGVEDAELQSRLSSLLSDDVKQAAERVVERNPAGARPPFRLDRALVKALQQRAIDEIAVEKHEGINRFFAERRRWDHMADELGANFFVAYLDDRLCLSEKQLETLRELYGTHWVSNFNDVIATVAVNGLPIGNEKFEMASGGKLKDVFSEAQLQHFEKMSESTTIAMSFAHTLSDTDTQLESIKAISREVLQLKMEELERLTGDLNDKKRKLTAVGNGACQQVVQDWAEVFQVLERDGPNAHMGKLVVLSHSIQYQIGNSETWKNALKKIFTKPQFDLIQASASARRTNLNRAVVSYLAFGLVRRQVGLNCSLEQFHELQAMLFENVEVTGNSCMESLVSFLSVPPERYKDLFSKDQWKLLEPNLQRQFETGQMMKARLETD